MVDFVILPVLPGGSVQSVAAFVTQSVLMKRVTMSMGVLKTRNQHSKQQYSVNIRNMKMLRLKVNNNEQASSYYKNVKVLQV